MSRPKSKITPVQDELIKSFTAPTPLRWPGPNYYPSICVHVKSPVTSVTNIPAKQIPRLYAHGCEVLFFGMTAYVETLK